MLVAAIPVLAVTATAEGCALCLRLRACITELSSRDFPVPGVSGGVCEGDVMPCDGIGMVTNLRRQ